VELTQFGDFRKMTLVNRLLSVTSSEGFHLVFLEEFTKVFVIMNDCVRFIMNVT